MAVGDTQSTTTSVRRVDSVDQPEEIRHFDELSHREQRRFLALVRPAGTPSPDVQLFDRGEVIVFTDYYRVTRS